LRAAAKATLDDGQVVDDRARLAMLSSIAEVLDCDPRLAEAPHAALIALIAGFYEKEEGGQKALDMLYRLYKNNPPIAGELFCLVLSRAGSIDPLDERYAKIMEHTRVLLNVIEEVSQRISAKNQKVLRGEQEWVVRTVGRGGLIYQ
jgi:hypothetical protein